MKGWIIPLWGKAAKGTGNSAPHHFVGSRHLCPYGPFVWLPEPKNLPEARIRVEALCFDFAAQPCAAVSPSSPKCWGELYLLALPRVSSTSPQLGGILCSSHKESSPFCFNLREWLLWTLPKSRVLACLQHSWYCLGLLFNFKVDPPCSLGAGGKHAAHQRIKFRACIHICTRNLIRKVMLIQVGDRDMITVQRKRKN